MLLIVDIFDLFGLLPKLKTRKSPMGSFWIGFFFGFIGLGIYFKTFVDYLLPVVIMILFVLPMITLVAIPFIQGLYGYFRAAESNKRNGFD